MSSVIVKSLSTKKRAANRPPCRFSARHAGGETGKLGRGGEVYATLTSPSMNLFSIVHHQRRMVTHCSKEAAFAKSW